MRFSLSKEEVRTRDQSSAKKEHPLTPHAARRPGLAVVRHGVLAERTALAGRLAARRMTRLLPDELPGVRSVEATNPHGCDELWIKVPQVHAMLGPGLGFQRFPVRNAATVLAVNSAQCSVSPDVLCSGLWMALDLHGAELEVHPWTANATAQRAIAVCCDRGSCRKRQSNRATVAGAFVHWFSPGSLSLGSVRVAVRKVLHKRPAGHRSA